MVTILALQTLSPLLLTISCPEDPGWWGAGCGVTGPSCYLMSQGPLSWQEAREVSHHAAVHCTVTFLLQFCMSRGGHLAEVTSAEEEELIDLVLIMGKQYWLGLNDLEEKGEFRDTNIILSIRFFSLFY